MRIVLFILIGIPYISTMVEVFTNDDYAAAIGKFALTAAPFAAYVLYKMRQADAKKSALPDAD